MTTRSLSFPPPLDCAAVDDRLADWLDDPAPDPALDRHLAGCTRCRALVDDLRAVSAQAATLPPIAPPAHLWAGVAARLGAQASVAEPANAAARVLPFDAHRGEQQTVRRDARQYDVRRTRRDRPPHGVPVWRLAAAAVVLVAATAGVTYQLARGGAGGAVAAATGAPNAATPRHAPATVAAAPNDPPGSNVSPAAVPAIPAVASAPSSAEDLAAARGARVAGPVPVLRAADADDAAAGAGAAAYDREIALLRRAVRERRGDLDSATVVVLLNNLRVIDAAIAESRAALARDPRSPFLGEQLSRALGRKVELLRTAALLPSA